MPPPALTLRTSTVTPTRLVGDMYSGCQGAAERGTVRGHDRMAQIMRSVCRHALTVPHWVCASASDVQRKREMPKSPIFTAPSALMKMLAGLRSR